MPVRIPTAARLGKTPTNVGAAASMACAKVKPTNHHHTLLKLEASLYSISVSARATC